MTEEEKKYELAEYAECFEEDFVRAYVISRMDDSFAIITRKIWMHVAHNIVSEFKEFISIPDYRIMVYRYENIRGAFHFESNDHFGSFAEAKMECAVRGYRFRPKTDFELRTLKNGYTRILVEKGAPRLPGEIDLSAVRDS